MDKVTFKGREYKVVQEFPVHPVLASEGLKEQLGIEGKRGSVGMMQIFQHSVRVVFLGRNGSRVESEMITA